MASAPWFPLRYMSTGNRDSHRRPNVHAGENLPCGSQLHTHGLHQAVISCQAPNCAGLCWDSWLVIDFLFLQNCNPCKRKCYYGIHL